MPAITPFAGQLRPHFLRTVNSSLTVSPNERDILDLVRRHGTTTRADLGRYTGLTAQSVMRLVDDLVERSMLLMGEPLPLLARGKPAVAITLDPSYAYSIGVSITTDSIALCLIDFAGNALAHHEEPIPQRGLNALLKRIDSLATRLLRKCGIDSDLLFGIGVGMTGFFIGDGLRMNPPTLLDDIALIEVNTLLAETTGYPVWLDNDGSVAAIGESLYGLGNRYRDFVYYHFAHGFGGGLILNNRCYRGKHGNGGEFSGMLPALGFERAALETLRTMLMADGLELPTIRELIDGYCPAWPAIERWIELVSPGLSAITSAVVAILDPAAIVLGGRIPQDLAMRLIPRIVIDNVSRRGHVRPLPDILFGQTAKDPVAIGAASLPFKECFFH